METPDIYSDENLGKLKFKKDRPLKSWKVMRFFRARGWSLILTVYEAEIAKRHVETLIANGVAVSDLMIVETIEIETRVEVDRESEVSK